MKEPAIRSVSIGYVDFMAYSQAPASLLAQAAAGDVVPAPGVNEWYSKSFRQAYAARLLKERGL